MAQQIKGKQIASQTIIINDGAGNVLMSGVLDTHGHQVYQTAIPTLDQHLTNKAYVDAIAQGVSVHAPVHVVSTEPITLNGTPIIDGHQTVTGCTVLVNGQANAAFNGIYVVGAGAWVRRADADGNPSNEVELGDFVFVQSGTSNGSTGWSLGDTNATGDTITPGTNTQIWYKIAAPGTYSTDGQGITLAGTIFSLELDGDTLTKGDNGLKLNGTLSTVISENTVNISVETSNRIVADATLTSRVSTEEVTRLSGDTSLSTAVANEISNRTAADASLSTAVGGGVAAEASERLAADQSLSTSVANEISNRIVADDTLTSRVSTEEDTRSTNVTSLSTAITSEVSSRASGDLSLSTQISQMSGATLDLSTIMVEGQVLGISGGNLTGVSYTTIVTAEGSTRLAADQSLSTAISTEVSTRTVAVSTEISNRTVADATLTSRISTEEVARLSGDTSLSTAVANEISNRIVADASLSTAVGGGVAAEASERLAADQSLSTAVLTEISDRTDADTSLTSRVSTEEGTRLTNDTSLSTVISTEVSTRTVAVSTEISNRTVADATLTSRVSTEEVTRLSGDTSLSTAVANEVSARTTNDQSLSIAIAALSSGSTAGVTSLSTALSSEISSRAVADTSLTSRVSTEEDTRATNVTSLSTSVANEISNRIVADASLSTEISDLNILTYTQKFTPSTNGSSTERTAVTTGAFVYTGVLEEDSVLVFMNGLAYPFSYDSGEGSVFDIDGEPTTGTAVTLYFSGTNAGFGIETTDQILVKYTTSTL